MEGILPRKSTDLMDFINMHAIANIVPFLLVLSEPHEFRDL